MIWVSSQTWRHPTQFSELLRHHWFVVHAVGGGQELWKNVPGTDWHFKMSKQNGQKGVNVHWLFSIFWEYLPTPKTKTCFMIFMWQLSVKKSQEIMNRYDMSAQVNLFHWNFCSRSNCFNRSTRWTVEHGSKANSSPLQGRQVENKLGKDRLPNTIFQGWAVSYGEFAVLLLVICFCFLLFSCFFERTHGVFLVINLCFVKNSRSLVILMCF